MGYSDQEVEWAKVNEYKVWQYMVEQEMLHKKGRDVGSKLDYGWSLHQRIIR